MPTSRTIAEFDRPDISTFRNEIYPAARPAIMRGLGADLEPVRLARSSTAEFGGYLKSKIGPKQVKVLAGKDGAGSTFFFGKDVSSYNFERRQMAFPGFIEALLKGGEVPEKPMLYIEATKIADLSAELAEALKLPIAPQGVEPLIWMGNRTGVQTHFDYKQNIAYVVSGRRKFTIFPPSQTPNLYMAPFECSPSSAPISMVDIEDPDLEKYPRFAEALEHAVVAELEPGDALYLPYMWWHHVQAIGELNVLVNYWWNEYDVFGSPVEAMLHSILTLRDLPEPMRDAWQIMYETFVFKNHGEPMEYIEPQFRGGMGPLNGSQRAQLWQTLGSLLVGYVQRMRGGGKS